MRNPVSGQ